MRKFTDRIEIKGCMAQAASLLEGMDFFFVGGSVRDSLLEREPKDVDIVVFSTVKEVSKLLSSKPFIVNERFNTARFIVGECLIDVNECTDSIDEELRRRDFTVNSIAAYRDGSLYDPFGGVKDIERGVIRSESLGNMRDDPLRMLRAVRFEEKLKMKMERGLKAFIMQNSSLIKEAAKERILLEFSALFAESGSGEIFEKLRKLNILTEIFPELKECSGFIHVKHKTRYLIRHLTRTAEALDEVMMMDIPDGMKVYAGKNMLSLYMAALFHDIEKPAAFTKEGGRQRFNNHDLMGAERSEKILRRSLKMPNSEISRISLIIKMHMRPHLLIYSEVSRRGLYRLSKDAGEDLEGLFLVSMADALASEGSLRKEYVELYLKVKSLEEEISRKKISFINGSDIMEHFSLKPSPKIGELIRTGNEYAVSENIQDKLEILKHLEKVLNERNSE